MLAFEIILCIVDQLGQEYLRQLDNWGPVIEERCALVKVALTCRVCRDQAYRYLKGFLECKSNDDLVELLINSRRNASAHTLTLQFGPSWVKNPNKRNVYSESLEALFHSLPRLQTLIVRSEHSGTEWDPLALPWLLGLPAPSKHDVLRAISTNPQLTSLRLQGVRVRRELFDCVSPSVVSLELDNVVWDTSVMGDAEAASYANCRTQWGPRNGLRSLKITSSLLRSFSLHKAVTRHEAALAISCSPDGVPIPLAGLQTIVISGQGPTDIDTFRCLLQANLPDLKKVVICDGVSILAEPVWFGSERIPVTMDWFHSFDIITFAVILDVWPPESFLDQLVMGLNTVTGTCQLKRINIQLRWRDPASPGYCTIATFLKGQWAKLDKALARAELPKLELVVLDVSAVASGLILGETPGHALCPTPVRMSGMYFRLLRDCLKTKAMPAVSSSRELRILF